MNLFLKENFNITNLCLKIWDKARLHPLLTPLQKTTGSTWKYLGKWARKKIS